MKPYLLAMYNVLKIGIKKIQCKKIECKGMQLFSFQTKILVKKTSTISLGGRIVSDGRVAIIVDENAELIIGNKVYFNEGTMISCKKNIEIGSGCLFGPNVKVFDNNHKFNADNGVLGEHTTGAISIGENCWIGSNVVILKGSQIGKNCVIGASCVISGKIPDSSIVTQNREIKINPIKEKK